MHACIWSFQPQFALPLWICRPLQDQQQLHLFWVLCSLVIAILANFMLSIFLPPYQGIIVLFSLWSFCYCDLYLSRGPTTPVVGSVWGEERLDLSSQTVGPTTRSWISGRKRSETKRNIFFFFKGHYILYFFPIFLPFIFFVHIQLFSGKFSSFITYGDKANLEHFSTLISGSFTPWAKNSIQTLKGSSFHSFFL